MIKVWRIGNLEKGIYPSKDAVEKLSKILKTNANYSVEDVQLIFGPDIECITLPDGKDEITKSGKTEYVLMDIKSEREYQDTKWGSDFDDKNTINDWAMYISDYMTRAAKYKSAPEDIRRNLVKVAALATAAIEAIDRNGNLPKRHYD